MNYSTLPEVAPDSAPEAVSSTEAHDRTGANLGDQKYIVTQDMNPAYPDRHENLTPGAFSTVSPMSPAPPYRPPLNEVYSNNYPASMGAGTGLGVVDWETAQGPPGATRHADGHVQPPSTKGDEARICGLKRKMFLILVAIVLVVLAIAIGGGVGGGLAARNKAQKASQEAEVDAGDEDSVV